MNYVQFGLFVFFASSVLVLGATFYSTLNKNHTSFINRSVYLGEALLIGSIFLAGELLTLSLIGLYRAYFLWSIVVLNFLFLMRGETRSDLRRLIFKKIDFKLSTVIFLVLLAVLIFRNLYFLIDVDSISTYLFTQKLWLSSGTSIIGNITSDIRIFVPHFDALPYSLGLSIFGQDTLFPQLVNLFWRLIVLLLVFGYSSYRLNRYYGLAASMFVLFDGHFFYSGCNHWVLINGALVALLFAVTYNFWEARSQRSVFRFILAIIFLSQLLANKYQMAYVLFFLLLLGFLIQDKPGERIREVCRDRKAVFAILTSFFIMSLWFIKNTLVTGDPVFPIFADKFKVFNFTPNMVNIYKKLFGGIKFTKFIKYMNYLFIWPGMNAAKYVIFTISFLPIILAIIILRYKGARELILELCFWLGSSILVIMGICLFCHQDPRYYRYALAILSFSAAFSVYCVAKYCFNIKKTIFLNGIIILLALPAIGIVFQSGGSFKRPDFKENLSVLFNKIHMDYAVEKHYPYIPFVLDELSKNYDKADRSAWDAGNGMNFPAFLLPVKPVTSLWLTTLVKWDSYNSADAVVQDLKQHNIEWIMKIRDDKLIFLPIGDYALEAVNYERYPNKTFFDYGFPQELTNINY